MNDGGRIQFKDMEPALPNTEFPLDFPFTRIFAKNLDGKGVRDVPYIVAGMVTASYTRKAKKLIDSCKKFRLPFIIYEVPTVHWSISPKGSGDLRFTKANFIHSVLQQFNKPILYLDVDTYFEQYPEAIGIMARSECEFAVYNWLADEHNVSYKPVEVDIGTEGAPVIVKNRFFAFSGSLDLFSRDQLVTSGAVQFYKNTPAAKNLLQEWHKIVSRFDRAADDHCLDFAFNNFPSNLAKPKACWFDKSYARYVFWIYVRPVINHPDWPYQGDGFVSLNDPEGKKRYYRERAQYLNVEYVFPRDCIVDAEENTLCRIENGKLVPFARLVQKLWI